MRTIKIFGWLSHFLWATLVLLSIFFSILVYGTLTDATDQSWLIQFMGKDVANDQKTLYFRTFVCLSYAIYLLYFYAIILFNLCVRMFEKKQFFDQKIIQRFKKIGLIFVANYLMAYALGKIFTIYSDNTVAKLTNFSELVITKIQTPLSGLMIGFFFLVLSKIFKEAKKQKEENELTI